MNIQKAGLNAYATALRNFTQAEKSSQVSSRSASLSSSGSVSSSFSETLRESLGTVNDLQTQKNTMIQSFASGEQQNVHELMISMQKAGLAMNLTAAVRNKVLEAYRELTRISF